MIEKYSPIEPGAASALTPHSAYGRCLPDRPRPKVRRFFSLLIVGLALFLVSFPVEGQLQEEQPSDSRLPPGRRTMAAERLREDEAIELDGRLDEPVWVRAVPATDFIQQDPDFGGTPTERTEVRIVFTRESLYMGVSAYDSEPDQLQGNTMKRDEFLSADDRFMWTMDTFLDQQTGYFFEMNPSGLMADALKLATGGSERAWDGIWDANARRHEEGWTLEIEIPFRTLNFDPDAPAWGINFQRTVRRKNEENLWTGHERNQGLQRMSNAGLLLGITDVTQGHGLDVKPYIASSTWDAPGSLDPVPRGTETDMGVDLFYNFTPSLRGNLTVNTDFAQTEVDQRLVNLTRFPLRFPEKRDFFLDGAPFFDFADTSVSPFLNRRRGFGPGGAPQAVEPFFSRRIGLGPDGVPQAVDVGSKLTGQAGAQDIGFLHVRTGDDKSTSGERIAGEDFTVMRVKRRVLTQSYLGSFFSRRHGQNDGGPADLYTGGLDFRLATSAFRGSDNLSMNGYFLWATDPEDQGENLSYGVSLDYPNDRWFGSLGFTEVQPNHDPAIGFTPRRGFRRYGTQIGFGPRPEAHPWIRQLTFATGAGFTTDMQNRLVTREVSLTPLEVQFHSQGDSFGFSVLPTYERLEEDFEIHPGVRLPAGADYTFTRYRFDLSTANRRVLATRSSFEFSDFFSGRREAVVLNLGIRPFVGIVANLETEWNRVDLPEGEFQTRLYRIVLDNQFNPWIYVVNNLQYDSVSDRLGWQIRFRWTIDPGSDLYVVYTQNWVDDVVRDRFLTEDRRGAAKFVYTYRW